MLFRIGSSFFSLGNGTKHGFVKKMLAFVLQRTTVMFLLHQVVVQAPQLNLVVRCSICGSCNATCTRMAGYIICFCCLSLKMLTAVMCSVLWQLSQNVGCSSPLLQEPSKLRAFFTCAGVLSVCVFAFWEKAVLCMNFLSFLLWWCVYLSDCCDAMDIICSHFLFVCLLHKRDWTFIKYKGRRWKLK